MRKLVDEPLCQLGQIADSALFNGVLEDESGYFSDASLYEDDATEDEPIEAEIRLESHGSRIVKQTMDHVVDNGEESGRAGSQDASLNGMPGDDDSDLILGTTALNRVTRSKLAKRLKKNGKKSKVIPEVVDVAAENLKKATKGKNRSADLDEGKAEFDTAHPTANAQNKVNASLLLGKPDGLNLQSKQERKVALGDIDFEERSLKTKRGRPRKVKGPQDAAANLGTSAKVKEANTARSSFTDRKQTRLLPEQRGIVGEKKRAFSTVTVQSKESLDQDAQGNAELESKKLMGKKSTRHDEKLTIRECEDVGSATSRDSEIDIKTQRSVENAVHVSADARSNKTQTVKFKLSSGVKNATEEARGLKPWKGKMTEISGVKGLDVVEGRSLEKARNGAKPLYRRNGFSKSVLTKGEKEQEVDTSHKGIGKGMANAITEAKRSVINIGRQPIKNHTHSESIRSKKFQLQTLRKVVPAVADNELNGMIAPTKSSRRGAVKESQAQNSIKDEDGNMRNRTPAEIFSNENSKASAMKGLATMEHLVNSLKYRKLKAASTAAVMRDGVVAHSSSTGKPGTSTGRPEQAAMEMLLSDGQPVKDFCASLESVHSVVEQQRMAAEKDGDNGVAGEEVSSGVTEGGDGNKGSRTNEKDDGSGGAEPGITDVGWVLCDDCHKWRCIPAELADVIEATNCRWSCKDNPNKKFADCSIPQEKSNAEINAELNISEVSFCEEGDEKDPPVESKLSTGLQKQDRPRATWTLIKHNLFQHRCRKTQIIDEVMVCHCVPPEDGGVGCGDECLNRMLTIECTPQTCPCGDLCSNQQFQRRSYAKVGWFRCGKKGFGLQILDDVPKGTFIIEYVGEVLDMSAYEARQNEYALRGQKHFYFMTLYSNEVIDACAKGNLGRFINHSCEPNCTTEKWMVDDEVCIGLFAIRDLAKGEEITFDYNYVRVCGAAAKKCRCGSTECRGFIGGDPMTPLAIVESDSDEDDPEPIMLMESYGEEDIGGKPVVDKRLRGKGEIFPIRVMGAKRKWTSTDSDERQGIMSKRVKTSSALRKFGATNAKRLTIETSGGRFEGVEERLNEMLDDNGGLCKRREVATHYLKLLVVTAASGDTVNGEASRSTRDLSMVLDALLKTLSRYVLMEIVNKNGLQILHNMIKRFRRNYKKTPIIRKLLKVLEFLAIKHVLTIEQINSAPPRYGVESVRDTIFELCRHADTEVQQIARRFRDKWIPRNFPRKLFRAQEGFPSSSSEQPNQRFFSKQHQHQACGFEGDASSEQVPNNDVARKRRRQSRWDQPSQEVLDATLAGGLPQSFWPFNASNLLIGKNHSSPPDHTIKHNELASSDELGTRQPGPPVFPAFDPQHLSATHTGTHLPTVVKGIPVGQYMAASSPRFIPQQVSVCVGIPVALGHQLNGPHTTGSDCSCFSQVLASSHSMNQSNFGQALPSSITPKEQQEKNISGNESASSDQTNKGPNILFGVSPSKFFQQMHGLFGASFHPWQLQALMAPHSWGPYLSGDARFIDPISPRGSEPLRWTSDFNDLDGNVTMFGAEQNGAMGQRLEPELEPEPPVPGLSPPPPPPQAAKPMSRHYWGTESSDRGNIAFQQDNSSTWRPWKWNPPRGSKFRGRRYKSFGHQRDYGYPRRYNRQGFSWQGHSSFSSRSHSHFEDAPYRQYPFKNAAHSGSHPMDSEDYIGTEGEGRPFAFCQDDSFEETENPLSCMQLEKPWGFGQEDYFREDFDNFLNATEEFSQERDGEDSRNAASRDK